jgi:hypothetical protein
MWGLRTVLTVALLTVILGVGAFVFAPAAHASSKNACNPKLPHNCVTIWATQVNVRYDASGTCLTYPSTSCKVVGTLAGGDEKVYAICQQPGQTITYDGYSSKWWMDLYADNGVQGWTSNVFIVGGAKISGIADCNY